MKARFTLGQYLSARHVGGSSRRGRNASNGWFAHLLPKIERERARPPYVGEPSPTTRVPYQAALCDICGKDVQDCKGPRYRR